MPEGNRGPPLAQDSPAWCSGRSGNWGVPPRVQRRCRDPRVVTELGSPRTLRRCGSPCSLRDWSVPPVPLSKGLGVPPCTGITWRAPGPSCPIWELQCPSKGEVGFFSPCPVPSGNGVYGDPPACPLWDLRSPSDWGYIVSPISIPLGNWGPHDPHVGVPVRGDAHHPTLFLQGIGVFRDPRVGMVPITP